MPATQNSAKLAQALQDADMAVLAPANIVEALRESERERAAGAIPVTVKRPSCSYGAVFLQDGVKLAQALQDAGGAGAAPANVAEALREFERERTARAIPVTVKSHMMGAMLQIRSSLVRGHPSCDMICSLNF